MARLSKEEQARQDGMDYAYRLAKRDGLDALEKRISRNMRKGIPAFVSESQHNAYISHANKCCIKSFMCIMAHVLRSKYGFGEKRLEDFKRYFIDLADSIDGEWLDFDDIVSGIKEETGVDLTEYEKFADKMGEDLEETLRERHGK